MGQIYQLVYRSESASTMSLQEVQLILDTSRQRNLEDGITGCLMYRNGYFLQILEGEKDRVRATYERIVSDSRHEDLQVMMEECVGGRAFEDFSMGIFANGHSYFPDYENIVQEGLPDEKYLPLRMFNYCVGQLREGTGFFYKER